MGKPWAGMDPNSQHQLWSRWTFEVWETGKHPSFADVKYNATKWLNKGFGSVGRARVEEGVKYWKIVAEIEGAPANDPNYVSSVRSQFDAFVEKGWGKLGAVGAVTVKILAGDRGDSSPRSQLIIMPHITG